MRNDILLPQSIRKRFVNAITRMPGLQSYHPFAETEGTTAKNYAPATIDGQAGTISGATLGQPGKIGRAFSFDGVDDVVTLPEAEFTATSKLGIIALVKATSLGAFHTIMAKRNGTPTGFQFRLGDISGDRQLAFYWTASSVFQGYYNAGTNHKVTVGEWTLIGVSFDWASPGSCDYLKNGVKITTSRSGGTGTTPDDPNCGITIGRRNDDAMEYPGLIQHIARFNTTITEAQHLKLARILGLA